MTDRDLGALLEQASDGLPELDLAEQAWAAAVAQRQQRRRLLTGSVAALAAAGVAVTAVQVAGSPTPSPTPRPAPAASSTTTAAATKAGTLSDGTPSAVMPAEGTEGRLQLRDLGLPRRIDAEARATDLSTLKEPLDAIAAVYLRELRGARYQPVLVTPAGEQVLVDTLTLASTTDGNNLGAPMGLRAVRAGGRYVVFAQPGKVVRLDTRSGDTVSYPVPSPVLEWAGWGAAGSVIVARDAEHAWTIDPRQPGAEAVPVGGDGGYEGTFRITTSDTTPVEVRVTRFDDRAVPGAALPLKAPVFQTWGETVNTAQWAATGAFFDQDVTSAALAGSYQGLLAVDTEQLDARVLLAPENPDGQQGRTKGCCVPLAWADASTLVYRSSGSSGSWLLAWDLRTNEVSRMSQLGGAGGSGYPTALALNVGSRD